MITRHLFWPIGKKPTSPSSLKYACIKWGFCSSAIEISARSQRRSIVLPSKGSFRPCCTCEWAPSAPTIQEDVIEWVSPFWSLMRETTVSSLCSKETSSLPLSISTPCSFNFSTITCSVADWGMKIPVGSSPSEFFKSTSPSFSVGVWKSTPCTS